MNVTEIRDPGSYVLVSRLQEDWKGCIGSLGKVNMPRGWYLYSGSALGPGGVGARVNRHLLPSAQKKTHWHIDYLRGFANICDVWVILDPRRLECKIAEVISRMGNFLPSGFGASDCGCMGHLIFLDNHIQVTRCRKALSGLYPPLLYAVIR